MSEHKTYNRNFLTLLSGNTFSQAIPFLMAPIISRLFSDIEIAVYTNYLAISSMIGIIAAGRLELAIPISREKEGAQEIAFTGLVITISLSMLAFVFPLFSDELAGMYNTTELTPYLISVPIAVLSYGLLGLANNWVLRHKKYSVLSLGKVSQSLVNSGLAALLGYLGWGASGLIVGWIASQFAGIIMLGIAINLNIKWKNYGITTIKSTLKEYRDFPLINSLHAFTDIFATQFVLFWIISSQFGLAEFGLFAMMNRYIRQPVVLVTTSVSQIFYTEASSAINEGRSAVPIMKKTIRTSLLFSFPFIAVILFFGPDLFGWYLSEEWRKSGEYAVMMIPILFTMFFVSPVSGIPILLNRQRTAYLITVVGYICTLGSFFLAVGAGWDFKSALLLYACCHAGLQSLYLYWMYTLIKGQNAGSR